VNLVGGGSIVWNKDGTSNSGSGFAETTPEPGLDYVVVVQVTHCAAVSMPAQSNLICAPRLVAVEQPSAARNGGSARVSQVQDKLRKVTSGLSKHTTGSPRLHGS
jgi:hypothetical protein